MFLFGPLHILLQNSHSNVFALFSFHSAVLFSLLLHFFYLFTLLFFPSVVLHDTAQNLTS